MEAQTEPEGALITGRVLAGIAQRRDAKAAPHGRGGMGLPLRARKEGKASRRSNSRLGAR